MTKFYPICAFPRWSRRQQRSAALGVYNKNLSTYGTGDSFDHKAAEGFIQLLGLELQEYGRVHGTGKP